MHPSWRIPIFLDTNASSHAIGGILSQVLSDGKEHVISYGSRTLDKAECNYSTTRREMLALVSFIKKYFLYLKAKRFTVLIDHQTLVWLNNCKGPEGQVARWQEALAEYDFEIIHRPGSQHLNADALLRIPMREPHSCPTRAPQGVNAIATTVNTRNWAQLQSTDPDTSITYSHQIRG